MSIGFLVSAKKQSNRVGHEVWGGRHFGSAQGVSELGHAHQLLSTAVATLQGLAALGPISRYRAPLSNQLFACTSSG